MCARGTFYINLEWVVGPVLYRNGTGVFPVLSGHHFSFKSICFKAL